MRHMSTLTSVAPTPTSRLSTAQPAQLTAARASVTVQLSSYEPTVVPPLRAERCIQGTADLEVTRASGNAEIDAALAQTNCQPAD